MSRYEPHDEIRRRMIRAMALSPILVAAPSLLGTACGAAEAATGLTPTPACDDGDEDDPTPSQTEGPFFTPSSPERSSLVESGLVGTGFVVSGLVLTRSCRPVANALLDFWQADDDGEYDNAGYALRGHQFTNAAGEFRLETIVPGLYPGRTRHIHVKVQAPNEPILTTQLYFPSEARNDTDGIFSPELLMAVSGSGAGQQGVFHFVLDLP